MVIWGDVCKVWVEILVNDYSRESELELSSVTMLGKGDLHERSELEEKRVLSS